MPKKAQKKRKHALRVRHQVATRHKGIVSAATLAPTPVEAPVEAPARGKCSTCGRSEKLLKSGLVGNHRGCEGAGQPPS